MNRRRWKWLLSGILITPLLVWGCDAPKIHWVGHTDLDIEFLITDADTREPIPGAHVEVQSDGGFYEEDVKQSFSLSTDADGSARKECRRSMCFGTQSGLKFTDTFAVHLPYWLFRVVADGYSPSEWVDLDVLEFQRQVTKAGPGRAKLVVPVSLSKKRN